MDVRVGLWRRLSAEELMHLNCGVGEDSWESLGLQGDQLWDFFGRNDAKAETPVLWSPHAKLTHWKRLWCWEGLGAGGEGDDRGWDGWMASRTRWTWVKVNSGSWWWTGRPGVLWFMGSQRVGHDWVTELNWTEPWLLIHVSILYPHPPYKWLLENYISLQTSSSDFVWRPYSKELVNQIINKFSGGWPEKGAFLGKSHNFSAKWQAGLNTELWQMKMVSWFI